MATYELMQIPRLAALVRDDRGRHPERGRGTCASRLCTLVVAVALPIVAGACVSAADPTQPLVPSTLNGALADVAHPALDWAAAFFSGANIVTLPIVPTRCPFESTSQFFVCSPLSGGGLTLNQRFTLLDAGAGKQVAFDAKTTTNLHLENSVAGIWKDTLTVDGQQVLDLAGLGTSRHTLNGSSLTLTSSSNPATPGQPTNTERKTTIVNLVLPVVAAGAPTAWPLSGTIDTRSRSITADGDTTIFIATMRFDGSSVVSLTITVPGGLQSCRVNLANMPAGRMGCLTSPDPPLGADAVPRAKPQLR